MLFLDVTSSCKSPMNTGVQRVVRSLYAAFRETTAVQPLIWDDQWKSYCRLSARELAFLSRSNAADFAAAGEPEFAANPWPWSKLVRHFTHRLNRLDLAGSAADGDSLFVPEIFQDGRIEWLADFRCRRPGIRCTALFYDAISVRYPEFTPPSRRSRFDQYMAALGSLDHVLAISEESAADLKSFWRVERINRAPPVTVHMLAVECSGPLRPNANTSTSRHVLCVSTLERRKNHLGLLRAAEILWSAGLEFDLELVGRSTRDWGEQVIAEVNRLAAAGRHVRWSMHVGETELAAAYDSCRFTVFPSLVEGFGLPIIESLWHGKPCVCGDRGAIAETAGGGGCLLTDVANPETLAGAMRELLTDDASLARLTMQAAARRFPSWADFVASARPQIVG